MRFTIKIQLRGFVHFEKKCSIIGFFLHIAKQYRPRKTYVYITIHTLYINIYTHVLAPFLQAL